jgi:hypothetical protein
LTAVAKSGGKKFTESWAMAVWLTWIFGVAAVVLVGAMLAWRPLREGGRRRRLVQAQRDFRIQRERLECLFLELAAASGKPRGLRWGDCSFENDVAYACDERSGELSAFVALTIRFEAIEGGGMEEVEAVGNLRAATAVFHFDGRRWQTSGRVVFNLNPTEAIAHFRQRPVMALRETAGQAR